MGQRLFQTTLSQLYSTPTLLCLSRCLSGGRSTLGKPQHAQVYPRRHLRVCWLRRPRRRPPLMTSMTTTSTSTLTRTNFEAVWSSHLNAPRFFVKCCLIILFDGLSLELVNVAKIMYLEVHPTSLLRFVLEHRKIDGRKEQRASSFVRHQFFFGTSCCIHFAPSACSSREQEGNQ